LEVELLVVALLAAELFEVALLAVELLLPPLLASLLPDPPPSSLTSSAHAAKSHNIKEAKKVAARLRRERAFIVVSWVGAAKPRLAGGAVCCLAWWPLLRARCKGGHRGGAQ
jgi:hypothetical protein